MSVLGAIALFAIYHFSRRAGSQPSTCIKNWVGAQGRYDNKGLADEYLTQRENHFKEGWGVISDGHSSMGGVGRQG
jgi:hypothetical protein